MKSNAGFQATHNSKVSNLLLGKTMMEWLSKSELLVGNLTQIHLPRLHREATMSVNMAAPEDMDVSLV